MIDIHIHVGQFKEKYYDPLEIGEILIEELGLESICVSSTTSCAEYNITTISREIEILYNNFKNKIYHFLWLDPEHLPDRNWEHKSPIPIHGIKIHPYAQNWNQKQLHQAWGIAVEWNVPILLHTGGEAKAYPLVFLPLLCEFPEVQVCLAHGRPHDQTIEVLRQCPNALTDTAFQSKEDIQNLINEGYADKILFGTDFPITSYFSNEETLSSDSWIAAYKQIRSISNGTFIKQIESNTRKFLKLI